MKHLRFALLCLVAVMFACSSPGWVTPTPERLPTATKLARPVSTATKLVAEVIAYQSLNVRVRPGEHEPVIGALYNGNAVTLTGNCSDDPQGWAQIVWKDGTAWVNSKYLSKNKCSEQE